MSSYFLNRLRWIAGAKGGSAAVVQTILIRIFLLFINLANGAFTARHFGPDGRGTQTAIGLWLPIFTFIFTVGVPTALRFHARKHEADRDQLFTAAMVLSLSIGAVAMVAGIVAMPALMHQYGPTSIRDAQYMMLFIPLGMLSLLFDAMLEAQLKFTFANFTRYAPPIITFFTLVTLAAFGKLQPFTAALAYAVPAAFISAGNGVYLVQRSVLGFADFARSCRRLLGYGIRIYGADVLGTFSSQIDQLLVVGLLSPSGLGGYTIALQASRVLTVFQVSLSSVLLPKASGLATHEVLPLVARTARLTIAITTVTGIGLILALPILLTLVYGRDFSASILISQILAVEAVFAAAAMVHTQAFLATDRPGMATVFQIGALATSVPLMLILIPRLGLAGAALSLLASTVLRLVLALASYPILLKAPIPKLILTRDDIAFLANAISRRSAT